MPKRKYLKYIGIGLISLLALIILVVGIMAIRLQVRTNKLSDDYDYLYHDERFDKAYSITDIKTIKQEISCGYAVLEMVSAWQGEAITEESLYEAYGKVVTSTGKSFEAEMNKQITGYKTTMYKYEANSKMLEKIYSSLKNNIPVPFEWAAQLDGTWTLHYSLITGIDFKADQITIANPLQLYNRP